MDSDQRTGSTTHGVRRSVLAVVVAVVGAWSAAATAQPCGAGAEGWHGAGRGRVAAPMAGAEVPPMAQGRLLDAVGASAEQKAKIRDIMKAAHEDGCRQHEASREARLGLMQLLAAPTLDTAAIETQRQKLEAQHDAASKRRVQAMVDAAAVLQPEQRKQLAERAAQRRTMMERHRRERETLERPRG